VEVIVEASVVEPAPAQLAGGSEASVGSDPVLMRRPLLRAPLD